MILVLPLGGGIVTVTGADTPLNVDGVAFPVADILSEGSETAEASQVVIAVKLAGVLRAGTGGWSTVVLAGIRLDGSNEIIAATRLQRAKTDAARVVSPDWTRVVLRREIRRGTEVAPATSPQRGDVFAAFRVLGRSVTTAGLFEAGTLLVRTIGARAEP